MAPPLRAKTRRRGRGEGSIGQRADGIWRAAISLGIDGTGKRKRIEVYGRTKAEVTAKLDELRAQARVGNITSSASITTGELLDRWLSATAANSSVRTQEERDSHIRIHLKPRLGSVRLAKLTALHIESLYADMHRDKIGPFAIRSAADTLTIALNYAVRLRLIPASPATAIRKPKIPRRDMLFLTDTQAKRLIQFAAGTRVGPLVILALASGCRQGELLALGWSDVSLSLGTLTVRRSLSATKSGFVVKEPKTSASRRTIKIPAFAVAALTALRAAAVKAGLVESPIFSTRTGNYLAKKNVIRSFRALVASANQSAGPDDRIPPRLRFHDLRHTMASLLLSDGRSLKAVAQRLGHASPVTTLRVYAHCMPTDDAILSDGLDDLLG